MNQKIFIITEGEFDRQVLSVLLHKYQSLEIISGNGISSAIAKAQSVFSQYKQPFLLLLDTDTLDKREAEKKKLIVNEHLGIHYNNSIGRVVWIEPELESIFLNNSVIANMLLKKSFSSAEKNAAIKEPRHFLDANIPGGRKGIIKLLNNSSLINLLLEDVAIKEILDFIEINRGGSFKLSNEKNERRKVFHLKTKNDFIAITKSVIPTLFGKKPNDWSRELMSNDIYLKINLSKPNAGNIKYAERHFQHMISPYHAQPVFEDYLKYPQEENHWESSTLEIEISSKNPEYKFEVQFLYDATKGVKMLE